MRLTIHRGSHEIGGTCIELQTKKARILLDFGLPLVDLNQEPLKSIKGKTRPQLIKNKILPNIQGLYDHPGIDAILISHPHQDHYGLLSYIHPKIPIFLSAGCNILIKASHFFSQTECDLKNINLIKKSFYIKDIKVTPYLVDHSGFAALAFLIEAEGKKLFYSGDFRGHGRKSILFDNFVNNPPKDIDYLLLEGSMLGRPQSEYETEKDVEEKMVQLFKEKHLFFVSCSSQDIDRIVSIYRACLRTGRILVLDPYTAYILDQLKEISPHIPQFDWGKNIKIFFATNSYTNKLAETKILFKYKSAKITFQEMLQERNKLVIKDNYVTKSVFAHKKEISGAKLIYSLWEGYLPDIKPFWDRYKIPLIQVHVSGHAYIKELQTFVTAVKPKQIIPIHTFKPEEYEKHFGKNILRLKDGEVREI